MHRKVSIITFCHRDFTVNYGQILQAFALYKTIESLGYKVTVISHKNRNKETEKLYKKWYWFPSKDSIDSKNFAKCTYFVRHYMRCVQSYNIEDVQKYIRKSDILIAGSDAIWRTMHLDPVFYLDIKGSSKKLKFSYASSFVNYIEDDKKIYKNMVNMIGKMDYVSTRERQGAELINHFLKKEIAVTVLDPTLLFGRQNWEHYKSNVKYSEPYVLMYLLDDTNKYDESISQIRKKYDVNVLSIYAGNKIENRLYFENGIGIDEFIGLIDNATAIITNSFHGTAFSIMFHKEVYIFKRENESLKNDFRFDNLVRICGMQERLIRSETDIMRLPSINYSAIDKKLSLERKKSMEYLQGALHDIQKKKLQ